MKYLYNNCPCNNSNNIVLKDYVPGPFVININQVARENSTFRTVLWAGKHLQLTVMNINVGEDIGLGYHPDLDQFIHIEQGQCLVMMGYFKYNMDFQWRISGGYAIIVPAGMWHNIINTGSRDLKLSSVYAPPQHPKGTIHRTKSDALAAENY